MPIEAPVCAEPSTPIYPGFKDPDDWRRSIIRPAGLGNEADRPSQLEMRARQHVEDATADHPSKHRSHEHPWCRTCFVRAEAGEAIGDGRASTPTWSQIIEMEAAIKLAGVTQKQRAHAKRLYDDDLEGDLDAGALESRMPDLPTATAEVLLAWFEASADRVYEDAQADEVTTSRAMRYLQVHGGAPDAELVATVDVPELLGLEEFLGQPDEESIYRIDSLMPVGGRVVFAAQYKAGKSVSLGNVVRSLADGVPFLDHFAVETPRGRVVLIDDELSAPMLRRWLREQGIANTQRVSLVALRGRVATFNLLDETVRSVWASRLREADAQVVLLDCLRPVLDSLGLSEDKEAGRFLVAFDALCHEAGVHEAIITHHMGHAGERSRGDTRLRDWPDVEWTLVRAKGEDGEGDPSGPRYFKAYGRDVDVPESLLAYDEATRRLSMVGGNRRATAGTTLLPAILDYLRTNPDSSGRQLETAFASSPREDVRVAVKQGIKAEAINTRSGPKRAILHSLNPQCASAPEVRQRTGRECASAPIGRTALTRPLGVDPSAHSSGPPERVEQPQAKTAEGAAA